MNFFLVQMLSLGAEYQIPLKSTGDEKLWDFSNIRGGLGLQISRFQMDYALVPLGDIGLTHRFTLSVRFDGTLNLLASEIKE